MDAEALYPSLVGLCKGEGLTGVSVRQATGLLTFLGAASPEDAIQQLTDAVQSIDSVRIREAVEVAFAIGYPAGGGLTDRQKRQAIPLKSSYDSLRANCRQGLHILADLLVERANMRYRASDPSLAREPIELSADHVVLSSKGTIFKTHTGLDFGIQYVLSGTSAVRDRLIIALEYDPSTILVIVPLMRFQDVASDLYIYCAVRSTVDEMPVFRLECQVELDALPLKIQIYSGKDIELLYQISSDPKGNFHRQAVGRGKAGSLITYTLDGKDHDGSNNDRWFRAFTDMHQIIGLDDMGDYLPKQQI